MPYNGLPPKPESERINRNPKRDKTVIESDEEEVLRGPDLPPNTPTGGDWCQRTQEWWYTWRTSPQAKVMINTDWEFMLEVAVLHNQFWSGGMSDTARANYLAEMRQRVAKFGATWEDRQKLAMQIVTPNDTELKEKAIEKAAKSAVYDFEAIAKKAAEVRNGRNNSDG